MSDRYPRHFPPPMISSRALVILGLLLIALLIGVVISCSASQQVQRQEAQYTGQQLQRLITNQPPPAFDFSQDRDTLIQIYRATNEAVATYTVVTEQGRILWACPSLGYAIPATTELTNPQQNIDSSAVIAQAEPNGLYTGTSSGTWIRCVRDNGDVVAVRAEQNVITFTHKVTLREAPLIADVTDSPSAVKLDMTRKGTPQPTVTPRNQ